MWYGGVSLYLMLGKNEEVLNPQFLCWDYALIEAILF